MPPTQGPPRSAHHLRRRVQFHELDSAGIVHFSWYLKYIEEAEHAMWREAGLSIAPPGAAIGFPRVAVALDYHHPLRFEDEFDVQIQVARIGRTSMTYECRLARGATRIASGRLTIACVSKRPGEPMTAVAIPAEIACRFAVATETTKATEDTEGTEATMATERTEKKAT